MNYLVGALALLSALVLAGTALSLFALHRAHCILRDLRATQQAPVPAPENNGAGELREAVEALAAQVRELQRSPAAPALDPSIPRPGLNLNKRSQVLRMHRHGESLEQISSSLQVPRQEVDLLLKVQRIVLSRV